MLIVNCLLELSMRVMYLVLRCSILLLAPKVYFILVYQNHRSICLFFIILNYHICTSGDFNSTPDRHLGAARVEPGLKPDLLISESTYATTIRDSKRARERHFLKKVHDCMENGGKVNSFMNFNFDFFFNFSYINFSLIFCLCILSFLN